MKIIFVSHAASLTGAPKFVFELAKIIASRHNVMLVTKQDGPLLQQAKKKNKERIKYFNVNNSHEVCNQDFVEKVETAKQFIKQHNPELVYVNSVASAEWVVASRICKVKNIFHLHEMEDECRSQLLMRNVTLDIMNYTDFAIYVSPDVEKNASAFFDSKPPNSIVMDCFFDCEKIIHQAKLEQPLPKNIKEENIDLNKPIVCASGVASYRKGVDIFFETACKLPHLQFLWIGKWNSEGKYTNPIEKKHLSENPSNFFLTGEVENPYFYLNLADLFVLSSREDPNPLIVIEALILGKQALCFSKTGGRRFVLDRWGYVLNGHPTVELLESFINRIFPPPDYLAFTPRWLGDAQKSIIKHCDKKGALPKFEKILTTI